MCSKSVHVLRCHAHDLGSRQTDIAQLPIAQSRQFTDGAASLAFGGDAIEEAVDWRAQPGFGALHRRQRPCLFQASGNPELRNERSLCWHSWYPSSLRW